MSVSVFGAGAFGTSLAISLARRGPVALWARNAGHVAEMAADGQNRRRLPNVAFADALTVTADARLASAADTLLLAVPMQALGAFLEENAALFRGKSLVACCKGLDLTRLTGPTALIDQLTDGATAAVLTGPSFAADIAAGLPTALTLACKDTDAAIALQRSLTTDTLRIYRTPDTTGAELGGALKNVIALASGVVIGAGLGESARAALMTRGFAELCRLAEAHGARRETLNGLSGFGDLVLTCTSEKSRNFRFGRALAQGTDFDPDVTVEGAATARAALRLAEAEGIDLPVTRAVVTLLDKPDQLAQVIAQLMARPLKEE